MKPRSLADGLAWFGIGLGMWELLAPRKFAETTGLVENDLLFRLFGLREIASGILILWSDEKGGPAWSRVAGDAMDSIVLLQNLFSSESDRGRVALSLVAVSPVVAGDIWVALADTDETTDER